MKARGGTGAPTAADSAALRAALPGIVARNDRSAAGDDPRPGPTQCHDITVYPAIGLAGGACEGYGLLLDISDPAHPVAHRRRGRLELLLLALGDVQQRRHQGPLLRRVGRRRPAEVPRDRPARSGAPTRSSRSPNGKMHVPELLQDARAADAAGELRRAQRLADPDPGPRRDGAGVVSGRHLGVRLDRRRRTRRRSRSSIAARWTRPGWRAAARGPRTGTTA